MLIWSLAALGLPLAVFGYVRHERPAGEAQAGAPLSPDQLAGPKPSPMVMGLAIAEAFRKSAEEPNAMEGPDVGQPFVDHLGDVTCWRFPFSYRASRHFSGATLHHGAFWVKDGHVLKEQWD